MADNKANTKATAKRQTRTPEQRAEEAYGVADRAVKKLERKVELLTEDLEQAKASLREAEQDRLFLARSPRLPQDHEAKRVLLDTLESEEPAPVGGPITAAPDDDPALDDSDLDTGD